jgi:hypothetical protein
MPAVLIERRGGLSGGGGIVVRAALTGAGFGVAYRGGVEFAALPAAAARASENRLSGSNLLT